MANIALGRALRQLLQRLGCGNATGDGELLARFQRSRDEAAFAELG